MRYAILTVAISLLITGCSSQKNVNTVREFDIDRYLGTWHEIYRLPFYPERGLTNVTATYSLLPDGKIEVLNQGIKGGPGGKHKKITGTAWQPDPAEPGKLKVRFFWPFASSYLVIAIDSVNYRYSLVTSGSGNLLWFLSRDPTLPDPVVEHFKSVAVENGIDVSRLIKVEQEW